MALAASGTWQLDSSDGLGTLTQSDPRIIRSGVSATRVRPSGTRCECHLAPRPRRWQCRQLRLERRPRQAAWRRLRLDYRRAMRRADVIAIALAVVAAVLGYSSGTGPLVGGIAVLVLAGIAAACPERPVHRRVGRRAAAVLGDVSGSVRHRWPPSRWPGARSVRLLSARERPREADRRRGRTARDARSGGRPDGQRTALVRPAPEVTAPDGRRSYGAEAMSTATVEALEGFSPHARRWFDGCPRDADAGADAGLAADRGGRAHAAVRARPGRARRSRPSCGSSTVS